MRVAVRAVGDHNEKMLEMLRTCEEINVVYCIDIDGNKWRDGDILSDGKLQSGITAN